jgi:hypothetical protein
MIRTLILVCAGWTFAGCLYDGELVCEPGQSANGRGACVCPEGMIPDAVGCVPCAANELAAGDQCVCEVGYARGNTGVCEPSINDPDAAPTGQGEACDTPTDCIGYQASYCDSIFFHECLLAGCADEGAPPCSTGWVCCDFTDLAGVSVCIDESELDGDSCPKL